MNISDFERQLREGAMPRDFPPAEAKWLELEHDLNGKRRKRLAFLPPRMFWAAAASVALLIAVGLYHLNGQQDASIPYVNIDINLPPALLPTKAQPAPLQDDTHRAAVPGQPSPVSPAPDRQPVASGPNRTSPLEYKSPGSDSTGITRAPEQRPEPTPDAPPRKQPRQPAPGLNAPLPDDDHDHRYAAGSKNKLGFGCSAFYGFAGGSSGANYRVSLDARKNLSGRVFASVQVVGSAGRLSTSSTYQYQTVSLEPSSLVPNTVTGTETVEAVYSGNIYTLGLSPSIGVRLAGRVSLSAGPDLQKVLTPSITLSNKGEFHNQINNQTLVADRQQVAGLDVGLQSAVGVEVGRRLSCSLLYRHGFTDYLKKNAGSTRNSFLSIGLSYRFN